MRMHEAGSFYFRSEIWRYRRASGSPISYTTREFRQVAEN